MKLAPLRKLKLIKMLNRVFFNTLIHKSQNRKTFVRRSALFMNGVKASENFVYITPYVDFPERIKQREVTKEQLMKRKANIELSKVEELWSIYKELEQRKSDYDKRKEEISSELVKLMKNDREGEATKNLQLQIKLIKDDIKKLKSPLWCAEEAAIVEALKLPNILHPETPNINKIIYNYLSPPICKKDHLKIGRELDLLYFKNNNSYYLKGDAAVFELGAKFYFSDILRKNSFHQFSNPDFVKSVIVEGCGLDHTNSNVSFVLHHNEDSKVNPDSRLHLTGAGSLCSFFAYYAKNVLYPKVLPLRYFSMGRQYAPTPNKKDSLFHVSQSSVVQLFVATKDAKHIDDTLNELINLLKTIYSAFNYHFRMSIVSADKLLMWESLRVIVEMYSTSLDTYVEVANMSISGNFISKRLMFTYTDNKQSHFTHIISGTILNVPRFIAAVLEQDGDFYVPQEFKVDKWTVMK